MPEIGVVIPFEERVRRLAHELAIEQRREKFTVADTGPQRTYTPFRPGRRVADFLVDGAFPAGNEASGTIIPWRVLDAPAMYLVIGEITFSDGRRFLDFGMNPAWVEANSDCRFIPGRSDNPVYICPDCDGLSGEHQRIEIPDRDGSRPMFVKCPRDTKVARR